MMESASKPLGGEEHHQMLPYDGIDLQSNTQVFIDVLRNQCEATDQLYQSGSCLSGLKHSIFPTGTLL